MAVVAFACASALGSVVAPGTFYGQVAQLVIAGGAGLAVYVGAAAAMRVDEVHMVWNVIAARLRPA